MTERDSVTVLMATVEGTAPNGDYVGNGITAPQGTPPELLAEAVQIGFLKLEAEHPGVKDLRVLTPWREVELPAPNNDEDDQT
jgi:hypothetical protein